MDNGQRSERRPVRRPERPERERPAFDVKVDMLMHLTCDYEFGYRLGQFLLENVPIATPEGRTPDKQLMSFGYQLTSKVKGVDDVCKRIPIPDDEDDDNYDERDER